MKLYLWRSPIDEGACKCARSRWYKFNAFIVLGNELNVLVKDKLIR
jgi:hypothetical protein